MINVLKAAGESIRFISRFREYSSNSLIRRILKFAATPLGLIKYFFTSRHEFRREGLALVLIAKNEAPYLEEWINFHIKQGVSHIFIYDNESTDNTYEILKPFVNSGTVTYNMIKGTCRQYDAYNLAISDYGRKYKYMAMIDADEFLYLRNSSIMGITLYEFINEFMREHPNAGGIGVNWLMFGSSGRETKPEGGVLKNFLMCSEKNYGGNFHIKTICDPLKVLAYINPHFPIYRRGFNNLDVSGEIIEDAFTREVHHEKIRINYYYTKSREEFIMKVKRGLADQKINTRRMNEFEASNIGTNDVKDTEILKNI